MLESRTLSISIERDWRQIYEAVWQPLDFTRWASGLAKSIPELQADRWWKAEGPTGAIRIRFASHNEFGIMDHYVDIGDGREVYIPMRIVPNENGAEVLFTLFRQPGMSEDAFRADAEWVERDLIALRALFP